MYKQPSPGRKSSQKERETCSVRLRIFGATRRSLPENVKTFRAKGRDRKIFFCGTKTSKHKQSSEPSHRRRLRSVSLQSLCLALASGHTTVSPDHRDLAGGASQSRRIQIGKSSTWDNWVGPVTVDIKGTFDWPRDGFTIWEERGETVIANRSGEYYARQSGAKPQRPFLDTGIGTIVIAGLALLWTTLWAF